MPCSPSQAAERRTAVKPPASTHIQKTAPTATKDMTMKDTATKDMTTKDTVTDMETDTDMKPTKNTVQAR